RILIADKSTCSVASIAIWRAKSGSWKASMTDYIELHARSAFSFLEGASTPEELIAVCSELKMPAMALLDRDGVYGAARFHLASKKIGIKAHIGAEVSVQSTTFEDQRPKQVISIPLLVRNRTGYQNLCRLITLMKMPLLATNGVCYATRRQRQVADVFTCIRNHVRLETAGRLLSMNSERFVKSPKEMAQLFADLPEAIANTTELSSRLEFTLQDL